MIVLKKIAQKIAVEMVIVIDQVDYVIVTNI